MLKQRNLVETMESMQFVLHITKMKYFLAKSENLEHFRFLSIRQSSSSTHKILQDVRN